MAKDPADAMRTAELLHDQAEYLLNDEIAYAHALKESRKTAAGLLLLVVGIGIFRFEMYRAPGSVPMVPDWAVVLIRWLFLAALGFLLYGGYRIYTERPLWQEFKPASRGGGSALSILHLRQEILKHYNEQGPLDTMRMKTDGLRLAYTRLRDANRRVRGRIASGTAMVFLGVLLVLVAFGVYTCTVDFSGGKGPADDSAHESKEGG